MTCCAYSCTQYGLLTQYVLLTHADDLLCLQLHAVGSPYTVHACNLCWWLAVPTAAHSRVSIHSTCFKPKLTTCCAYSCTLNGLNLYSLLRFLFDSPSYIVSSWNKINSVQVPKCIYLYTEFLRLSYMMMQQLRGV